MRRTSWRKMPDLSNKMQWEYAEEPTLLNWTVKAIDRKILAFDGVAMICIIAAMLCIAIYSYLFGDGTEVGVFCAAAAFMGLLFYKHAMQKTIFVYRATKNRLEICEWQDIPDLAFTFLRIYPFIIIGIILMLLIGSTSLSIAALAGPTLVGIGLASIGGDSNYKTIHRRFRQYDLSWKNIDRAMLDRRQGLLALSISGPDDVIEDHEIDFNNPEDHRHLTCIYFRKDQELKVLDLFKEKTPRTNAIADGNYNYVPWA